MSYLPHPLLQRRRLATCLLRIPPRRLLVVRAPRGRAQGELGEMLSRLGRAIDGGTGHLHPSERLWLDPDLAFESVAHHLVPYDQAPMQATEEQAPSPRQGDLFH